MTTGPSPIEDNAFLVLGLSTEATAMDIERAAQKLLAQLALSVASATTYDTPFGARARDETKIREAAIVLRTPEQRVLHELWATAERPGGTVQRPQGWAEAMASIHWSGRCPP